MSEDAGSPATPASEPTVAVLGTGTMGAGMARSLRAAGLPVRAWNRTPERARPLADDGIAVSTDLAEAVRGADVVVTMLFDADSVASTIEAAGDALAPGTVWLQTSTVGVAGCDRLAALAAERGLVLVDAPVVGTKGPAEQGALVVLASGPDEARAICTPVLDAIGQRTLWLGPAGAGSRLKLAANAWVITVVEGIAESLALARELGVDPRLFLEAVRGGAMDAPYVQLKGTAMLEGDFAPSFSLDGASKDAGLVVEAATSVGLSPGLAGIARERLAEAVAKGYGGEDLSAVFRVVRPHH
jgi:3-hydroxyisobutyrate dehydrogenase